MGRVHGLTAEEKRLHTTLATDASRQVGKAPLPVTPSQTRYRPPPSTPLQHEWKFLFNLMGTDVGAKSFEAYCTVDLRVGR